MHRGRTLPLLVMSVSIVAMLMAGSAGCGGGSTSLAANAPAKVANPPDLSLAQAISAHGVRAARLTSTDTVAMLDVILASNGVAAAERQCASATLVPLLQPDAQGNVRIASLAKVVQRLAPGRESTAMAQAVTACIGPETAARRAAKAAAPDRDLRGVEELGIRLSTAEATAIGFTATEANCYATHLLGGISPEEIAGLMSGTAKSTAADPRKSIRDCVSATREAELATQVRQDIAVYEQCVKDVTDQISRQIDEGGQPGGTTTTAPPGATTTTIKQCS